jgi:ATP-dependent exoDNAse (exonuclease V) alpha subunit
VKDLNVRARELLQAQAQLPENELRIGGRDYATGDRVVATRNDRARGILNGQRGTITAIAPSTQTIAIALDNGGNLALDRAYLAAGWVEHAYALTAHRAQGATVDQAFVLADDQMTREWAYTRSRDIASKRGSMSRVPTSNRTCRSRPRQCTASPGS